jgi:hypothetical protein
MMGGEPMVQLAVHNSPSHAAASLLNLIFPRARIRFLNSNRSRLGRPFQPHTILTQQLLEIGQ